MPFERSCKYSLLDDYFPSKLELEPLFKKVGLRLMAEPFQSYQDSYFDDAFGSLEKAGWFLKKRPLKAKTWATLRYKEQTQREMLTIEAEYLQDWPVAIQSKLLSITFHDLSAKLELLSECRNYRIFQDFSHLASLSFKQISAKAPASTSSISFSEAELTAHTDSGSEKLSQIAEIITTITPLTPNSSHELERAFALLSLTKSL